jgi:repressor LexA
MALDLARTSYTQDDCKKAYSQGNIMNAVLLTPRQKQVLEFVRTEITTKHIPPTRKEIATHFGFLSANAAEEHLRALARHGVITLLPGTSRGIRLIGAVEVPSHVDPIPQN